MKFLLLPFCIILWVISVAAMGEDKPQKAIARVAVDSISHGGLVSMNADGSDLKVIAKGSFGAASWSPDGSKVVFFRHGRGKVSRRLYVMNADGSDAQILLPEFEYPQHDPTYSPDGRLIAFIAQHGTDLSTREIYVCNSNGEEIERLTNNDTWEEGLSWSHDGSALFFTSGDILSAKVIRFKFEANVSVASKATSGFRSVKFIDVSDDGRLLAFSAVGPSDPYIQIIYVSKSDGSSVKRISTDGKNNTYPAWSPGGRYIAYVRYNEWSEDPKIRGDLVMFDVLTETRTTLLKGDLPKHNQARPSWVPTSN